ncbi:MAG: replication initiation protein [Tissierella sp.]|uniref:replication initiation protein n=1 Tax=Tissierella sp. TaxID=41274 RepID=UPI003F999A55
MKNKLVVKANKLIEARYNLSLNEQKIILYAVSKLNREKEKFNILELETREFIKLLGTTGSRYVEIKKIVTGLMKKQVSIETEESDLVANWVSSIKYIKNTGEIELEFSENLIPYLLQLKESFTRYELKNILYLKNKYSIRIYELLKQYEIIGKREFELKEFKRILFLENQYERIYDFRRFVLEPVKEDLNKNTDINISYKEIKKGRKITGLLFKIEPKNQDEKMYIDFLNDFYDIKNMKLKMGLKNENFSPTQVMALYEKAVEMAGNEDVDLFEYIRLNYLHIKDKARNKYAYLLKALENDYASAIGQISVDYYIKR